MQIIKCGKSSRLHLVTALFMAMFLSACGSTENKRNTSQANNPPTSSQASSNRNAANPQSSCLNTLLKPVENARRCLLKANQGDADAMFMLGRLLSKFGPDPRDPKDRMKMDRWKDIGNQGQAIVWFNQAAKAGSIDAMKMKCAQKNDVRAPRLMRDQATFWCEKLKQQGH